MQSLLFAHHTDESAVLTVILQQIGCTVRAVRDLENAISQWPEQPSDLIMVTLPDEPEFALQQVQRIRTHTAVPIIVVTDPLLEDTQVKVLETGADLLVIKPYSVRFLSAQIRAILRRSAGMPFFSLPTLTQADLTLDPATRTVKVNEQPERRLTQLEFRLLYTLITHVGQIIPTENIVEHVWGYSGDGNRELVRGLVQRLRSKVEPDPHQPRYILTEPGIGYYFTRS